MGSEMGIELKGHGTVVWENDTSQLQNMPVAQNSNLPGAASLSNNQINNPYFGTVTSMKDLVTSMDSTLKEVLNQFKILRENPPSNNGTNPDFWHRFFNLPAGSGDNNKVPPMPVTMSKTMSMVGTGLSMWQGYNSYQQSMLRGDVLGAKENAIGTASGGIDALGNTLLGLTLVGGIPFAIAGAATKGVGAIGKAIQSHEGTENTKARIQLENVDTYDNLLRSYGRATGYNNSAENSSMGIDLYRNIAAKNKGYGLSDSEFVEQVAAMKSYGMAQYNAENAVQIAGALSQSTNADFNNIANLEGLISRYGGTGSETVTKAYQNAEKMGFNNMQFNELLEGIQEVMQDGISKGFVQSADDIMGLAIGLTTASNKDAFFSGKEGMQRIQETKAGIQAAANLNTTGDMLMAQAVAMLPEKEKEKIVTGLGLDYQKGSILNDQVIMRSGVMNSSIYNNILDVFNQTYGDNKEEKVFQMMPLFGGNMVNAMKALQIGKVANETEWNTIEKTLGMESEKTRVVDFQNQQERLSTTNNEDVLNRVLDNFNTAESDTSKIIKATLEMAESADEIGNAIKQLNNMGSTFTDEALKQMETKGIQLYMP